MKAVVDYQEALPPTMDAKAPTQHDCISLVLAPHFPAPNGTPVALSLIAAAYEMADSTSSSLGLLVYAGLRARAGGVHHPEGEQHLLANLGCTLLDLCDKEVDAHPRYLAISFSIKVFANY